MPARSTAKKPRPEEQSDSEISSQEEEIDYDDLDLNVSYVGKIKLPKPPARLRGRGGLMMVMNLSSRRWMYPKGGMAESQTWIPSKLHRLLEKK
jgi:hypothetical protein